MAETPQIVRDYLGQLDRELTGMPEQLRGDIASGIAEELSGLDAPTAARRIEELGDPAFIAAEARAASGEQSRPAPAQGATERGWYVVLTSLLVMFGGIMIPLLGLLAGLLLLWLSKSWRRWEKWVATVAAPAIGLLLFLVLSLSSLGAGQSPAAGDVSNPQVPVAVDWTSMIVVVVMTGYLVTGLWLLARGLRRSRQQ